MAGLKPVLGGTPLIVRRLLFVILALATHCTAAPPIWETDFGEALTGFANGASIQRETLPFAFPCLLLSLLLLCLFRLSPDFSRRTLARPLSVPPILPTARTFPVFAIDSFCAPLSLHQN